jgi:NAD(P)-dependent dehydrogenase (short-subunit alcohol dehydrogenase family)
MNASIAHRRFDMTDQHRFADASGDRNPMHMDPIAARRTQAGAPVAHGVHAVLWALDALIANGRITKPIIGLDVRFQKFIYLKAEAVFCVVRETDALLQAEISADGLTAVVLKILFTPAAAPEEASFAAPPIALPQTPLILDLLDLPNHSGTLPRAPNDACARIFPHAAQRLGANAVESIAQLSTLVGMICPGLHSIFSGFSVQFAANPEETNLCFTVRNVDERFRMLEIAVAGGGIFGTVTAFVRQPPITPPAVSELAPLVGKNAFAGTTALIVGGSRGLGALTAKVIAAGGGRVVITYIAGETEAREIAEEIGHESCSILRYDAREDAASQLVDLAWNTEQLYYFATTQIFRQKAAWYVADRFRELCRIYADGFEAICSALQARGTPKLTAFYPSSVAVTERPKEMTEYSMAKAAGELLCADMNRFIKGMRVVIKRLPRVLTDQTATVMPTQSADPLEVMLPIIREMHADGGVLVEA